MKKFIFILFAISAAFMAFLWKKETHSRRIEFQPNEISEVEASKSKHISSPVFAHVPPEKPKGVEEASQEIRSIPTTTPPRHLSLGRSKNDQPKPMKPDNDVALPKAGEIILGNVPLREIPVGAVLEVLEPIAIPSCRISLLYDFEGVQKAYKSPPSGECTSSDRAFQRMKRWYDKPHCELIVHPQHDPMAIEKGMLLPVAHMLGPQENGFGIYLGFDDDPVVRMIRCTGGTDAADVVLTTEDLLRALNHRVQLKMPLQSKNNAL